MKLTELPQSCPDCQTKLGSVRRPVRKLQKKAILLFLFGVVATIVWALLLFCLVALSPVIVVPRHPAALVAVLAIIVAPGILIGGWALRLPKVVRLKCNSCQWSSPFLVDNRG